MKKPESHRPSVLCWLGRSSVRQRVLFGISIFSFVVVDCRILAQAPNEESYRNAMLSGKDYLDKSYKNAASADQKAKDAATIRKAGCKTDRRAAEANAKPLLRESDRLTEEANRLARKALDKFRLAETLESKLPEPKFGEALALLQLKAYCAAIEKIESLRAARYQTPEITFALGLALVSSSDARSTLSQQGIELLGKYIKEANASRSQGAARGS